MTDPIDNALSGIKSMYTENLATHGLSSKSVGWKDEASQLLRFQKLEAVLPARGTPFSVADWGCGYGAMLDHLLEQGHVVTRFDGYDISEEMLAAARARHAHRAEARFHLGSTVLEPVDFVFVSGTFNVRMQAEPEAWQTFIHERLDHLWSQARRGLAFNLLTTYVDWQADLLYYASPTAFFDHCARHFSRHVTLLHDYSLYEWTMLVHREPTA